MNLSYTTLQVGFEFIVVDNLQIASFTNPIVVLAPLGGGTLSAQIGNAGGAVRLTWAGTFYILN